MLKKSEGEGKKAAYYPFLGDENFDKVKKEIKKYEGNNLITNELLNDMRLYNSFKILGTKL